MASHPGLELGVKGKGLSSIAGGISGLGSIVVCGFDLVEFSVEVKCWRVICPWERNRGVEGLGRRTRT